MTPKTGLGKLLWRDLNGMISRGQSLPSGADTWIERAIAAIEAEAVAAERERIRTAVRMLPPLSVATEDGDEVNLEGWVSLAEVLAIAKAKETP